VRIPAALILALILSLAACKRGAQSNDAVRQGVIDHLGSRAGLNLAALDVGLSSVQIDGAKAKATVSIKPKGGSAEQAMAMTYDLELQDNKWVVVGRQEPGGMPHGGGAAPPAASPHGAEGGAPGGKMPSPADLPPAGKKK
jgi:hypothetical protein